MSKKLITGIISLLTVVSFAGVALAAAMTSDAMHSSTMPSSMMMMHPPAPMILTVSASGQGRLRGVVESVSATSFTVAAWGGTWTINVTTNTNVIPGTLSSVAVGDYVGASGMVSEDSPMMTADVVRDWSKHTGSMMHGDNMMQSTTSGAMMH